MSYHFNFYKYCINLYEFGFFIMSVFMLINMISLLYAVTENVVLTHKCIGVSMVD